MSTRLTTLLGSRSGADSILVDVAANFAERHSLDDSAVSATYTMLSTDQVILCDATSAAFSVTLLPLADCLNKVVEIVKVDSSGHAVTVDGDGTEPINGATTASLASQFSSIRLLGTATRWLILSKNL